MRPTTLAVTVTDEDTADNIRISLIVDKNAQIVNITPTTTTMIEAGSVAKRTTQTFMIQAIANEMGDTTVTVQVFDGTVRIEDEIVVSISKNVAPVITGLANQTIEPNMTRSVIFTVTDENIELGDTVTVSTTVTDSTILTVESVERVADTNSYLVAITAGATVGNTTLTVTARDSAGNSDTREVRVVCRGKDKCKSADNASIA